MEKIQIQNSLFVGFLFIILDFMELKEINVITH